jgi:hypothetical protein
LGDQWEITSDRARPWSPWEGGAGRGQEGQGQQEGGGKKQPFSGPLGSWQVGHRMHVGCGEEDMERSGREQWTVAALAD